MSWPHIFFKKPSPAPVAVPPPEKEAASTAIPAGDSVADAMAKADPLRELSRSEGGVRLTRRVMPEEPSSPIVSEPTQAVVMPEAVPASVVAPETPFLKPSENQLAAATVIEPEKKPVEAISPPSPASPETPVQASGRRGGLFGFRRKARMTEVARILPTPPEPKPDPVSPPSFSVFTTAGDVLDKRPEAESAQSSSALDEATPEKAAETKPSETKTEEPASDEVKVVETQAKPPEEKPVETMAGAASAPKPVIEITPAPEPAVDGKTETKPPAEPTTPTAEIAPAEAKPKSELILANGERVMGRILSETPEALYVEHSALGVLTIPRAQIAQKPIEVILINGDRIVGDLIAENAECLYVRHASLGMLTVPHHQRSTRVVEVILRDGDRILGEVLAETGTYTVLRSATLGTVTVQHDRIALMNRKLEQMPLKALPPALEAPKPPAQA